MPNLLKYILAAAVISAPALAHAAGTLIGTSVTGQYYPMGSSPGVFNTTTNYFDPTKGYVPAGYGNSSSATATIADPGIEFALVDGGGIVTNPGITGYTTDFTGLTVTLTQYNNWPGTLSGFEEVFTDPAFAGMTVTKTSDNFANGPMTATLVGDTLTISIAPNCLVGSGCSGWGKVGVASWTLTRPIPPVIAIGNPSNNAGFPVGFNVNAVYTCTDALSGTAAASCVGTLPSGTALNTSTAGTQSFSVTATDLAGNTTTTNTSYLISALTLTTPGSIWTIAGDGIRISQDDSGPATSAPLYTPFGVATDLIGNVYIADVSSQRIRKLARDGSISTVAGNGAESFGGDGQLATSAGLNNPFGVAVDGSGNIYIADSTNNRIRKVTPDGYISTFAGGGSSGLGDGGPATNAILSQPSGVAVDSANNLYIAENGGNRIRKVAADGTISTVAGNGTSGFSGDAGPAASAELSSPYGLAVDGSGNLYIADLGNSRIRKVTGTTISTVAGTGQPGYGGDGQPATAASLFFPTGVAVDANGNLYIADTGNNRIRVVSSVNGLISTVAGSDGIGFAGDGGMATSASLNNPNGVALDSSGNLYIADYNNQRIRLVPGVVQSDTTPPSIAPNISGTLGSNGWYTSNVTVAWTVTDPLASIISQSGCGTTTITADTTGQVVTCTAVGQGGSNTQSVTIKRDTTLPVATAAPAPLPNSSGWNDSTVTVSFSGSDAVSGIASCSAPVMVTTQGANQTSASGTCTNNAGLISAAVAATGINIDETSPVVTDVISDPNPESPSGWYTAPVTVTFAGTDPLSGVAPGACTSSTLSTSGAGQSVMGTCTNLAGDVGSFTVSGINVDLTTPVASYTAVPPPNANGWNNTPVIVNFSGTDDMSGSGIASCTAPISLTATGAGQVAAGTCTSVAGTASAVVADFVNIDLTPPTIFLNNPLSNAGYPVGANVIASYGCVGTGAQQRAYATSCSGTVASGSPVDTNTSGTKTFSVTSTDVAGNSAIVTINYFISTLSLTTPGSIWTIAGNGIAAIAGDGGAATSASLYYPAGVAVDAAGNLYIVDTTFNRIRKVSTDGTISTVAGTGTRGFSGDGGVATSAELNSPIGVAVDAAGNLYIADSSQRIRKVSTDGTISTVAGTGTPGFSGDGGLATNAAIDISGIGVDAVGNFYIADQNDQRIRKVSTDGTISTVAGTGTAGFSGDGGAATSAELNYPQGVTVDAAGNLYIADLVNARIRKIAADGTISTVAGNGTRGFSGDGGLATNAEINNAGIAVDSVGNLYIADQGNQRIRKVGTDGTISTVAGSGTPGFSGDGGVATSAELNYPTGVAVDAVDNLYIADVDNLRIRLVPGLGHTDTSPPTITPTISGSLGTNGWYTSAVTVTWTVNDPLAPIISQTGCGTTTITTDTTGQIVTCTAVGQGGTNTQSVTIKRDATPPVASATPSPLSNSAGWNDTNVTVNFSGVDSISGIAHCTAPIVLSTQGAGQSVAGTCVDNAGNVSAPVSVTGIDIEFSGPVVADLISAVPNSSGWYNSPITISFTGSDPLSGVAANGCSTPVTLSTNGAGQSVTGTCVDLAGNGTSFTVSGLNLDTIPPVATATLAPPPNANGWNNTPVTVSFAGTDTLNGSGVAGCSSNVTFSTEGAAQVVTGTCQDVAGNLSQPATATVNLDITPPSVWVYAPLPNDGFVLGETASASFVCNDGLSGTASCTGPVANGQSLNTQTLGTTTFAVSANDLAGNAASWTNSYTINPPGTAIITSIAGDTGLLSAGAPAANSSVAPEAIALDATGNVYLVDLGGNVLKINSAARTVTHLAGNGSGQYSGDGGAATAAGIGPLTGVAVDPNGNVFVAEYSDSRIRRIDAVTDIITTVAGDGTEGLSGDGGPAANAQLYNPLGVAIDSSGNVYIADTGNNRIRVINAATGIITTLAGTGAAGFSGDGGVAAAATLNGPPGIAVDAVGNVFVGDSGNYRVRRIDAVSGVITTVAGNGTGGYGGDGGAATSANLGHGLGLSIGASGNLYIADGNNQRIRVVQPNGVISTIGGTGVAGFTGDGGPATSAELFQPLGVAAANDSVFIADAGNSRVRRIRETTYTLAPAATFGGQPVGVATAAMPVTLTNLGVGAVAIGSVSIGGTNANQFSQTNNCGTAVAPSATCTFSVVFKPTSAGAKVATLAVNGTGGTPTKYVGLSGNGGAVYTLSPRSLAFGQLPSGTTSSSAQFTLKNSGSVTLPVASIKFTGTNANQFTQTNTCGTSVAGAASCAINVTFAPTMAGALNALLTVKGGAGGGTEYAYVTGTGLIPSYSLSTATLSFLNQAVGVPSAAETVVLTNTGLLAVPMTSISVSGTQYAQTNTCGTSVPVGASCTVSVVFTPLLPAGSKSATLTIKAGSGAGNRTVAITGTGIVPTYTLSATTLAFFNQAHGTSSAPIVITLTNTGSLALPITNVATSGQFSETNSCGSSVPGGGTCVINVTFSPTSKGAKTGTLTVTAGGGAVKRTASLTGTGT